MVYEITLMYKSSLTEDQVKKGIDSFKESIKTIEGKVVKEDFWGKRKLAYEISNAQEAYYLLVEADIPSDAVKKINAKVNITTDVIRHLITRKTGK